MIVRFHDEAFSELVTAALWYEEREEGLGTRFVGETTKAVAKIGENPLGNPFAKKPFRVSPVGHFPYSIFYQFDPKGSFLRIYSIYHQKRHPGIWKERTLD